MSTYSMAQIESLTGISAHTLRIWERRYSFLSPGRTKTNIRFYSDQELVKLLNISLLTRNGFKISKIDKMDETDLHECVTNVLSNVTQDIEDEISGLTLCMLEMNEEEFQKIFQRRTNRKGLQVTITELIYPFLKEIEILWSTNKLIPAQEHFISNLIRQKIITAIDSLPLPAIKAPTICMFLLEGEDHEMGLLLASYIARDLGWRVIYLGQNVPVDNIKEVVRLSQPLLMFSMFVVNADQKAAKLIAKIKAQTDVTFLVSGSQYNFTKVEMDEQVRFMSSPQELISHLQIKE
jgi:DNA-binding transcriptional MerR regulator